MSGRNRSSNNNRNAAVPLWAVFVIALAVAAAAILVYDRWVRQAEREVVREVTTQLESARIEKQEEAVQQALHIERVRQGLVGGAALRVAVTEHYISNGELPARLEDVGYSSDWTPSPVLESVELRPHGVIVLHFAPEQGFTGEVMLTPVVDADNLMIREWTCTSTLDFIANAVGGCSYVRAGG